MGACLFLPACFSSQIPLQVCSSGWEGSRVLSLRLSHILSSCWYQSPCKASRKRVVSTDVDINGHPWLVATARGFLFLERLALHPFTHATSALLHHTYSSCCCITSDTRSFSPRLQNPRPPPPSDRATLVTESASRKTNDRKWAQAMMLWK